MKKRKQNEYSKWGKISKHKNTNNQNREESKKTPDKQKTYLNGGEHNKITDTKPKLQTSQKMLYQINIKQNK